MDTLGVSKMWSKVIRLVKTEKVPNINISVGEQQGIVSLSTSMYLLEIIISQKRIGYDFKLAKHVLGRVVGCSVDTNLYPFDTNPKVTRDVYDDVYFFLQNLLSNKLYYGSKDDKAVVAIPNKDGSYRVTFTPKRRFMATIGTEEWPDSKVKNDPDLKALVTNED